jgi:3-phosphoshikimate 1-carboxyvinyltransferase
MNGTGTQQTTTSLTISPGGPLRGSVVVPGDKSITHRAVILSALAEGNTVITGYGRGEDCLNTMRAFRSMGIAIEEQPDRLRVSGKGLWGLTEPTTVIDCGNSGTGIRLLTGLLAGQDFFSILTGDESVRRRPMGRVVKPLRQMGASIAGRKGGELAPLAVTGTRLRSMTYVSPVASAQVKSSLLLAGLFAEGKTTITEPSLSRDHTERMFGFFGIPFEQWGLSVTITGRPASGWPGKPNLRVPGDISAAAFFLVGGSVVPGSDLTIREVGINATRSGVLDVLTEMGAKIDVLNPRDEAGEPVADLRVQAASLHGVTIGGELIPRTIDEIPILCVAAAFAQGTTMIAGAGELRVKESDRIAAIAAELKKLGVAVTEQPDGLTIAGIGGAAGRRFAGTACRSYGDHRIAMSLAIASLVSDAPIHIDDTACIETSFPSFESKLLELLT